jgi:RNA polymerase sigma-70 factor, ECF subfamily
LSREVRKLDTDELKYVSQLDRDTFRRLMETYGQDVWHYIYFLTRQKDAADDLAQEVFLKAYTHIRGFRGESSVKTWLLTIARNLVTNYKRSAYFRRVLLVDYLQRKDTGASAEQLVMERFEASKLWSIVLQLPARYREVLLLEAHYGLSMKEMAGILGIQEGTVKSRLSRARAKVEKAWREVQSYE